MTRNFQIGVKYKTSINFLKKVFTQRMSQTTIKNSIKYANNNGKIIDLTFQVYRN